LFTQRYMERVPAGGEIVIFDRSWYNRAGVEYVMGFVNPDDHQRFLSSCPQIEKYVVDAGIIRDGRTGAAIQGADRRSLAAMEALSPWTPSPTDAGMITRGPET